MTRTFPRRVLLPWKTMWRKVPYASRCCDGLASHPGGVKILLIASCYRNRNKLRPDGPVGSHHRLYLTPRADRAGKYRVAPRLPRVGILKLWIQDERWLRLFQMQTMCNMKRYLPNAVCKSWKKKKHKLTIKVLKKTTYMVINAIFLVSNTTVVTDKHRRQNTNALLKSAVWSVNWNKDNVKTRKLFLRLSWQRPSSYQNLALTKHYLNANRNVFEKLKEFKYKSSNGRKGKGNNLNPKENVAKQDPQVRAHFISYFQRSCKVCRCFNIF